MSRCDGAVSQCNSMRANVLGYERRAYVVSHANINRCLYITQTTRVWGALSRCDGSTITTSAAYFIATLPQASDHAARSHIPPWLYTTIVNVIGPPSWLLPKASGENVVSPLTKDSREIVVPPLAKRLKGKLSRPLWQRVIALSLLHVPLLPWLIACL